MITRNRGRTALAELKQQQQVLPIPLFKPQQSPDRVAKKPTSTASELQTVDAVAIVAQKMNVISLDSSSEEHGAPGDSARDAIDLSESSKSVMDISSSDDDDDGEESFSSEDGDRESESSEDENHGQSKSSSSTPASKLLAGEVAELIRGGDLKKLKVDDCRTYLRNYGLRVTGTKPVLIDRIKQHIELKKGGSSSYNRSTFTVNCTGDVCKGDVVFFNQKVSNKFSAITKSATQTWSRTVAGRVVKESYGAQRQQHTFTVEVLWSTGCRPLAPMKQLLVKGRNLYKRRTFRQRWADEGERRRSLDEKHERGAAARQVRAMKQWRYKGHAVGGFRLEGPSRKQLANPYTNTLASKENSNFSSGTVVFQSAVAVHQVAAGSTQPHVVHRHISFVSTGANTIPLGKSRQFGLPSGDGEINRASGGGSSEDKLAGANATSCGQFEQPSEDGEIKRASGGGSSEDKLAGANATPCGQFEQPSEDGEIKRASGGASTSVNKHRQWFKPTRPSDRDARTQQDCEAPTVLSSSKLPGGSSGLQAEPSNSRQSGSIHAPISISTRSQGVRTRSHNSKRSSSLNRPSSPFLSRPMSPLPNKPSSQHDNTSKFPSRPSSPYHNISASPCNNRPSSPHHSRPPSPYHSRPSSPYHGRPASPLGNRPPSPFPTHYNNNRPSFPYHGRPAFPLGNRPPSPFPTQYSNNRPSSPYHGRPASPLGNRPPSPFPTQYNNYRPSSPYHGRPSSPYHSKPSSSFPNRPASESQNRPASPLPSRLSSFNSSRPRSPSPSLWEGILGASPSSPVASRPASPSLNTSLIMDGDLLGSAPSSPLPDSLASQSIIRPTSPKLSLGQKATQGSKPNNQSRLVEDSDSTKWRTTQGWPPVCKDEVARTGFPCPTASCPYRGSRQCSSGVCYHCCKKKGGACCNPRHRPEFS